MHSKKLHKENQAQQKEGNKPKLRPICGVIYLLLTYTSCTMTFESFLSIELGASYTNRNPISGISKAVNQFPCECVGNLPPESTKQYLHMKLFLGIESRIGTLLRSIGSHFFNFSESKRLYC